MRVDLSSWELHNIEVENRGLVVRRGLIEHIAATDLQAGSVFVDGFSIEAQNTTEVYHYLFVQDVTTRAVTLYMTDDEYNIQFTYSIGVTPRHPVFTYALSKNFIMINSPHMHAPLFGVQCGGLIEAVKGTSLNPETTALTIPLGLVTSWGDRFVIAQGNLVFVSDPPDTLQSDVANDLQTFVKINAIDLPANIYRLVETGGALLAVTSDGVYSIPTDALGQGQEVRPFIARTSTYGASDYRAAALSRGDVAVLTRRGMLHLGTGAEVELADFGRARSLAEPVGASTSGDYRRGTIWPSEDGFWVSIGGKLCRVDEKRSIWIYASEPTPLVGMLRSREGGDILMTPDRLLQQWGNVDFTGDDVVGVAVGGVKSDPSDSLVVRFITTAGDQAGGRQRASIRGQVRSATTRVPPGAGNVLGTSLWSASSTYLAAQLRSARHAYAVRTDALDFEVAIDGSRTRIGDAAIETKGQGKRRS